MAHAFIAFEKILRTTRPNEPMPNAPGLFLRTLNEPAQRGDRLSCRSVRRDPDRRAPLAPGRRPGLSSDARWGSFGAARANGRYLRQPVIRARIPTTAVGDRPQETVRRETRARCVRRVFGALRRRVADTLVDAYQHPYQRLKRRRRPAYHPLPGAPYRSPSAAWRRATKRRLDDVHDLPEDSGPAPEPGCVTSIRRYFRCRRRARCECSRARREWADHPGATAVRVTGYVLSADAET